MGQFVLIQPAASVLKAIERELKRTEKRTEKAAYRALTKSMRSGKTLMSTDLRKYWNLPKRYVHRWVYVYDLSRKTLSAKLAVSGRRTPLRDFMTPTQLKNEKAKGLIRYGKTGRALKRSAGVRVKVYKSKGAEVYPGTFVATMKSGHTAVWKRDPGVARLPIKEQRAPEDFNVPIKKDFNRYERRISEQFEKNLERELAFEFKEFN